MYIPRHIKGVPRLFGSALLYLCLLTVMPTSPVRAQQTITGVSVETARGVELYRKGETKEATVKHILIVKGLEYGLTEEAVRAARKIKFVPAQIDGRPVSQYVQIEYNFNLY